MKMNIEFIDPSQAGIQIPTTEAYLKSVKIIGEKLDALNLTNHRHNSFALELAKHIEIMQKETFVSGIKLGLELAKGAKK